MLAEHKEIIGFVKWFNWVVLLVLGSASFCLMDNPFTVGLVLGGLLSIANFDVFERSVRAGFSAAGGLRVRKASAIAKCYLRLLFLGGAIYVLLKQNWVHPVGLLTGLSIVVISITGLGVRLLLKNLSPEAT